MSFRMYWLFAMYVILEKIGTTLIKLSRNDNKSSLKILGIRITVHFVIGILMYGLSFLLFVLIVPKIKVSVVLPILSGINSIIIALIGCIVFKERITLGQLMGIAVVITGTVMIGVLKG